MPGIYEKRMARVIDYIHANIDGDLSLDTLADVAAMSRFHWHRVFHGLTGETLAQATRRIRLFRASILLIETEFSLSEISKRCGYPNTQSFARAFRAVLGLTPAEFRKRGVRLSTVGTGDDRKAAMFDIEIRETPEISLVGFQHNGPYIEIGAGFERLMGLIQARGLIEKVGPMTGIYYHDPSCTEPAELKSFAGVHVPEAFEAEAPLEPMSIPAGRAAVLSFQGHYAELHKAYTYLYGVWLPASGEETRDAPPFEIYLNSPQDTAPDDLQTQLHLPLK